MDVNPPRNRWYDQHPLMDKSIRLMETFPAEIQNLLAENIVRIAEDYCGAGELMKNIRSLGTEKVLGIFKSKNKRRAQDKIPSVHQALNYMFILPDNDRTVIANRTIEMVNLIYEYLKNCQAAQTETQTDELSFLLRAFASQDMETYNRVSLDIQKRLYPPLAEKNEPPKNWDATKIESDRIKRIQPEKS